MFREITSYFCRPCGYIWCIKVESSADVRPLIWGNNEFKSNRECQGVCEENMLKLRDGKRNRNYHTAVKSVVTQVSRKKEKKWQGRCSSWFN